MLASQTQYFQTIRLLLRPGEISISLMVNLPTPLLIASCYSLPFHTSVLTLRAVVGSSMGELVN